MNKYQIILYWSNDDKAFIAEVPELPGCMAHGDTQETALKNIFKQSNCGSTQLKSLAIRYPNPKDGD
jgi:hypothetical protein